MDWIHIGLMIVLSALKRGVKNPASVAHLEGDIDALLDMIYALWPDKRPANPAPPSAETTPAE